MRASRNGGRAGMVRMRTCVSPLALALSLLLLAAAGAHAMDGAHPLANFDPRKLPFIADHLAPEMSLDTSMFVTEGDLGISKVFIPYMLHASADAPEEDGPDSGGGNVHIWLKFMQSEADHDAADVRGFMWFESAGFPIRDGQALYQMPQSMLRTPPSVHIAPILRNGSASQSAQTFDVERTDSRERPWWLRTTVRAPLAPVYQVTLDDGMRPHPLPPVISERQSAAASEPTFHFVIAPHHLPPAEAAEQLLRHMRHHKPLGFSSWLAYVPDALLEGYAARAELRPAMGDRSLWLLHWQSGPLPFRPDAFARPDLALAYNHALLAFAGRNAYLALADLDDWLLTPLPQASVTSLFGGCMRRPGVATLAVRDYTCGECGGSTPSEVAVWRLKGGGEGEKEEWERQALQGAAQPDVLGRAIVRPDAVFGWLVHSGALLPHTPHANVDAGACAHWARMPREVGGRRDWEFDAGSSASGGLVHAPPAA